MLYPMWQPKMPYGYLPCITIPSRITNFSLACIDHIFVKLSRREKRLDIISSLFYCDISDHLQNFISIKHNRTCCKDERPMTRLFIEKNAAPLCAKNGGGKLEWHIYRWWWLLFKIHYCSTTYITIVIPYCPGITETLAVQAQVDQSVKN